MPEVQDMKFFSFFSFRLRRRWSSVHYKYYLLTPWSRVLLEKLTGFADSQEIPRIYGTRKFITVLTSARHLSLSWAHSIQPPQLPPTSWSSILILSSHLHLGLPILANGSLFSRKKILNLQTIGKGHKTQPSISYFLPILRHYLDNQTPESSGICWPLLIQIPDNIKTSWNDDTRLLSGLYVQASASLCITKPFSRTLRNFLTTAIVKDPLQMLDCVVYVILYKEVIDNTQIWWIVIT
jgi:hypothetical protein